MNKVLLTGPDILQKLIHKLIRFRQHQIAVSADIEGTFLQVGVLPSDQPAPRFLWREDPSKTVEVYQYTRHIFGAKESPTCASYALQRTARDHEKSIQTQQGQFMRNSIWIITWTEKNVLMRCSSSHETYEVCEIME